MRSFRRFRPAAPFILGALIASGVAYAQSAGLTSLRGETAINELNSAPLGTQLDKPANGFGREYRQQPPMIPHKIEGYQLTKSHNKCLGCHAWPQNAQFGAPKVSETHYETRTGAELDEVSPRRWFCTQCHMTQANAPALVGNAFKNAREMDGAFQ